MQNIIELEPVKQIGHNCKSVAIATVEQYFAKKIGFKPIPLYKGKTHQISIRELAKNQGSFQGELLEHRQVSRIFEEMGYETETVDFSGNYSLFEDSVRKQITQGNLIIACFSVDLFSGNPKDNYQGDNEHAAILNGFDARSGLNLVHWHMKYRTTFLEFYKSSIALPKERMPEYYTNIKDKNKLKKYDLSSQQNDEILLTSGNQKSITPEKDSGFRGRLFVIKKPELQKILKFRANSLAPFSKKFKEFRALYQKAEGIDTRLATAEACVKHFINTHKATRHFFSNTHLNMVDRNVKNFYEYLANVLSYAKEHPNTHSRRVLVEQLKWMDINGQVMPDAPQAVRIAYKKISLSESKMKP